MKSKYFTMGLLIALTGCGGAVDRAEPDAIEPPPDIESSGHAITGGHAAPNNHEFSRASVRVWPRQVRWGMPATPTVIDPDTSSASIVRCPVVGAFRNAR